MTQTKPAPPPVRAVAPAARRVGYVIAIGVNAVLLYVVNNLLEWEWPSFLTDDFDRVLPVINVSLVATMIVNAVYLAYDRGWFKSLTQAILAVVALVAAVRMYQVFPFDFSAYDFNWEAVTRVVLILAIVGSGIGAIAESVRFPVRLLRDR